MNRYMKIVALALCCVAGMRAMEQEALLKQWTHAMKKEDTQQEEIDTLEQDFSFDSASTTIVRPIDENEIIKFKKLLQSEDKQRGFYQKLTLGGAVVGGLAAWWYWASCRNAEALAEQQRFANNLIEFELSNRTLEKEKRELDAARAKQLQQLQAEARRKGEAEPTELPEIKKAESKTPTADDAEKIKAGWVDWAYGKVKNTASSGWSWGVVVPVLLIKSRVAHEISNYMFGFFPYPGRAARFVFYPWSLNWCLNERTQFYKAAVGLKTLTAQVLGDGETSSATLKSKFWYNSTLFVTEMEKVLGYMHFILASLRPGEDKAARDMGRASISLVRHDLNEYAQRMTTYLQLPAPTKEQTRVIARISENALYNVIIQLESFEYIANVAGQEDADGRDRFSYWKSFIKPDLLPDSPKVQEDTARAEDDADFKAFFDTAVKINDML